MSQLSMHDSVHSFAPDAKVSKDIASPSSAASISPQSSRDMAAQPFLDEHIKLPVRSVVPLSPPSPFLPPCPPAFPYMGCQNARSLMLPVDRGQMQVVEKICWAPTDSEYRGMGKHQEK